VGVKKTDFLVVPTNQRRGRRHKLKYSELHSDVRTSVVDVGERWHRLPKWVVESPSLEILRTKLDVLLSSRLKVTLLGAVRWDQVTSRGTFQPQLFCGCVGTDCLDKACFLKFS